MALSIRKLYVVVVSRVIHSDVHIGFKRFASTSVKVSRIGRMEKPSHQAQTIIKSPLDKREYRGLTLSNKVKVLLISDPLTDKAAASLSVAAGSMNDPIELPGLAHFCEHMLFLGTEKYPEENDYAKYLAENGGSSNAYTARDHTNYYFDVSPHSLRGALDRFSQFFISPLFTESATEREVNAVNSEHEKNIPSDPWRSHQLEVGTSNPNHPYSHFATGNRETLWTRPRDKSIDVRSALMEYHRAYYSANLMSLVVLGAETLDELQLLVEELFLDVDNRDVEAPIWTENPYGPNELQTRIEMVPIKDIRHLSVMFPIPDTTPEYKSSAEGYLSHLIGHEGQGSLLSLLKENNWVNHLEAGSHVPARGFGTFKVAVDLTEEGLQNTENIVEYLFQYLKMLKELGPQKWVWEEMRDVNAMLFRFKDKERPQSLVSNLSSVMHSYPLEDVLSAGYILTDYNPKLISEILSLMTATNARVTVVSKDFDSKTKHEEEWYKVKYNQEKMNPELIAKWDKCERNDKLQLPPKNEFIPSVFDLKPREDQKGIIPQIISDTPLSRVWFLQDNEFMMPKAVVRAEIFSTLPLIEPLTTNLNHMMITLIKDLLTEYSYAASVAGLNYVIADSVYGLEIIVNGYDHKLGLVLNKVVEKLVDFEVDPKRFEVLKDFYLRSLKNWEDEQPYSHASYYFTYLLREKRWSNQELISAMKDVTAEKLQSFAKEFISKVKIEWLVHGNLTSAEALEMTNQCLKYFESKGTQHLIPAQTTRLREIELPAGSDYIFKSEHKSHSSSCAAVLFQTGLQGTHENVVAELLEHIANEPCFNQLRTKEQLGYIVFTGVRRAHGTQGIQILVQSDRHPEYVESRIDSFLNDLNELLKNMTQDEFVQHRTALSVRKAEKPKKLIDRANLIWSEMISQQYNFEKQQVELAELDRITLEDVNSFFHEMMALDAKTTKKLSVHVVSMVEGGAGLKVNEVDGEKVPEKNKEEIVDVANWKRLRGLYPCGKPYMSIPSSSGSGSGSKSKL